jgi:hypothetical protein
MAFPKNMSQLCSPSFIYFVISAIGLAIAAIQNMGNSSMYCLGSFSCSVPSTILVFIVKIVYVLFWTWILNLICRDGYTNVAWLLVLFPFILLFVILGLVMVNQKSSTKKQKQKQK